MRAAVWNTIAPQFNLCLTTLAVTYIHIVYTQPDRHSSGSNYTLADGNAKWFKPESTLNPNAFLWGKRVYSAGGMAVLDGNGVQVR